MDENLKIIKADIKEVKNDIKHIVKELIDVKQDLKFNTKILDEHQRRSLASENRLTVVEKFVIKSLWTIKLLAALGGILLFLAEILPITIKIFRHLHF